MFLTIAIVSAALLPRFVAPQWSASTSIENSWSQSGYIAAQTGAAGNTGKVAAMPRLTGRVVDLAGLLNASEESSLVLRLEAFERKSSDQIVVATIPSLGGVDIESYSNRLFREWELGQEQENNGVLLLVSRDDRKLRIEVGYGLEGVLTDAASSLIINNVIVPEFRKGNFSKGITDGAEMIISVLSGDTAELEARSRRNPRTIQNQTDWAGTVFIILWALLFFGPLAIAILVPMFGEKLGPGHYKWLGIEVRPGRRRSRSGSSGRGWRSGGGRSSRSGGFSGGGGSSGGGGASGGW